MITLKESILGSMGMGDKYVIPRKAVDGVIKVYDIMKNVCGRNSLEVTDNSYSPNIRYDIDFANHVSEKAAKKFIEEIYNKIEKEFKDDKYVSYKKVDQQSVSMGFYDIENADLTSKHEVAYLYINIGRENLLKGDNFSIESAFTLRQNHQNITKPYYIKKINEYIKK